MLRKAPCNIPCACGPWQRRRLGSSVPHGAGVGETISKANNLKATNRPGRGREKLQRLPFPESCGVDQHCGRPHQNGEGREERLRHAAPPCKGYGGEGQKPPPVSISSFDFLRSKMCPDAMNDTGKKGVIVFSFRSCICLSV